MIKETAKALKNTRMETNTKVTSKKAKHMEEVFSSGSQERPMMASGSKGSRTGMGYGEVPKESTILGSGKTAEHTAKECTYGVMEINTKETGKTDSSTGLEVTYSCKFISPYHIATETCL